MSRVPLFNCDALNFLLDLPRVPHPSFAFCAKEGGDFDFPSSRNEELTFNAWENCVKIRRLTQASPRLPAAVSTIVLLIISEAVAAGDGTFST